LVHLGWSVVSVDPRAETGFAADAARYERVRPLYPDAAVERLMGELDLTASSSVLDLAAGTGKLTRSLVGRVGRVAAVEPSEPMRAVLSQVVPHAEAVAGTAEAIPVPDAAVDAVFVGEAFHWFRTVDAAVEIARVLVGGGGLALLWNRPHWDEGDNPWLSAFGALVQPLREEAGPMPIDGERWVEQLETLGLFGPLARGEAENVQRLSRDDFVALVASWTWIANLDGRRQRAVLAGVRDLLGDQPSVKLRYRTKMYWTRKRVGGGSNG
jgi:SAM-dependent methyltransferase